MNPAEYLRKPYGRVVVPEPDGTFRAEIVEFPGCIAVGDTAAEALANLEEVATSWLEVTLQKGQRVPEPMETVEFSGKLLVRLPKSLHRKAAYLAEREGVSLNHLIVSSIAEQVGARSSDAQQTAEPSLVSLRKQLWVDFSARDVRWSPRQSGTHVICIYTALHTSKEAIADARPVYLKLPERSNARS